MRLLGPGERLGEREDDFGGGVTAKVSLDLVAIVEGVSNRELKRERKKERSGQETGRGRGSEDPKSTKIKGN